ncbi:MAG: energy transducer TonB, partial [Rhodocyclaceae bacterium]|nr:energy transducer TonB [Rhodocyclaceae bacterium]
PAPPAPPAPAAIVGARFDADYLHNPKPVYPSASRRLGEQGRVLLRVYVSAEGRAEKVEVKTSSGFQRLDQAAEDAVSRWRFVPAKRGDQAVAAWVQVPITFQLDS